MAHFSRTIPETSLPSMTPNTDYHETETAGPAGTSLQTMTPLPEHTDRRARRENGSRGFPAAPSSSDPEAVLRSLEGLAISIAARYTPSGRKPDEDLCQEARLGVLRALKDYDPAKASLATHAWNWARGYVSRAADKAAKHRLPSLQDPAGEEEASFRGDFLADEDAADPCEETARAEERERALRLCRELPRRDYLVLARLFGLDGHERRTLAEIAAEDGCAVQRVHFVKNRALARIRKAGFAAA